MGDMSNRAAVSPYLLKPRGPRPSPPNRNQASALCRQNEGPTTRDNNGGLAGALLVSATNEEILRGTRASRATVGKSQFGF